MRHSQHGQHGQHSKKDSPEEERARREAIVQLNDLCDLIGWLTFVGKRTRHGDKPGAEPWIYTRQYIAMYVPSTTPETVIERLQALSGADSETRAALWLGLHMEEIP